MSVALNVLASVPATGCGGALLRSRPADLLDALSVIDDRWLSSPGPFARPYFRTQGQGRHRAVGRAAALVNLCLHWIVEPDPRVVFGFFHYECLLGYPLLTPSTIIN